MSCGEVTDAASIWCCCGCAIGQWLQHWFHPSLGSSIWHMCDPKHTDRRAHACTCRHTHTHTRINITAITFTFPVERWEETTMHLPCQEDSLTNGVTVIYLLLLCYGLHSLIIIWLIKLQQTTSLIQKKRKCSTWWGCCRFLGNHIFKNWSILHNVVLVSGLYGSYLCFFNFYLFKKIFFCLFAFSMAASHGIWRFPGWGPIGAVAAGLRQSHSKAGSQPLLWPTPQLTVIPDP